MLFSVQIYEALLQKFQTLIAFLIKIADSVILYPMVFHINEIVFLLLFCYGISGPCKYGCLN